MIDVILGLQWGDEGKGKIVDYFAPNYSVIARFQGGANAGHTLYIGGEKIVLHQIPSGVFHDHCINLIGNGVVLDPVTLKKECELVASFGVDIHKKLFIAEKANLIIPTHKALDRASELQKGDSKIGSTLKGIGPAYMDKTGRNALRVGDILDKTFTTNYIKLRLKHQRLLDSFQFNEDISAWEQEFFEAIDFLKTLNIVSGEYFIHDKLQAGNKILAEGAQGSMLDIDFGTFPFVTSSSTISAGVCTGLGVNPKQVNEIFGVTKAYCTRVGSGPFPTELDDVTGEKIRKIGNEFGATTGRSRRCGWIDLVTLNYACMINGVTQVIMTKADVLDSFETLDLCTAYAMNNQITTQVPFQLNKEKVLPQYIQLPGWNTAITGIKNMAQLPEATKNYVHFIDQYLKTPIKFLSNGPERDQIIPL